MLLEIKKFGLLLKLFKELLYDKDPQGSFTSATFNPRKFTILLIFMFLLSSASLMFNRTKALAIRVRQMEARMVMCLDPAETTKERTSEGGRKNDRTSSSDVRR